VSDCCGFLYDFVCVHLVSCTALVVIMGWITEAFLSGFVRMRMRCGLVNLVHQMCARMASTYVCGNFGSVLSARMWPPCNVEAWRRCSYFHNKSSYIQNGEWAYDSPLPSKLTGWINKEATSARSLRVNRHGIATGQVSGGHGASTQWQGVWVGKDATSATGCSCKQPHVLGLPCVHIMRYCQSSETGDAMKFVQPCLTTEALKKLYEAIGDTRLPPTRQPKTDLKAPRWYAAKDAPPPGFPFVIPTSTATKRRRNAKRSVHAMGATATSSPESSAAACVAKVTAKAAAAAAAAATTAAAVSGGAGTSAGATAAVSPAAIRGDPQVQAALAVMGATSASNPLAPLPTVISQPVVAVPDPGAPATASVAPNRSSIVSVHAVVVPQTSVAAAAAARAAAVAAAAAAPTTAATVAPPQAVPTLPAATAAAAVATIATEPPFQPPRQRRRVEQPTATAELQQ